MSNPDKFFTILFICRPLQRMVVGMVLAGLAFVVAGFVQLKLQSSQLALSSGESKLIIYNNALPSLSYHIEGSNGFESTNLTLNYGEVSKLWLL